MPMSDGIIHAIDLSSVASKLSAFSANTSVTQIAITTTRIVAQIGWLGSCMVFMAFSVLLWCR